MKRFYSFPVCSFLVCLAVVSLTHTGCSDSTESAEDQQPNVTEMNIQTDEDSGK